MTPKKTKHWRYTHWRGPVLQQNELVDIQKPEEDLIGAMAVVVDKKGTNPHLRKRSFSCASICMLAALLSGRNLVKISARAWTPSTTSVTSTSTLVKQRRATTVASRPPQLQLLNSLVLSSPRGGANRRSKLGLSGRGDEEGDKEEPQTGWNHNLPDPASPFWKSPKNGEGGAQYSTQQQQQQQQQQSSSSTTKTSRTGWLHNTKPNAELEKEKKQQALDSKSSSGTSEGGVSNKAQLRLQQAMMQALRNHRIVEPPTFHACGATRQVVVTEHRISLPVDRSTTTAALNDRTAERMDVAFCIVEEVKNDATKKFFSSLQSMTPQQRGTSYVQHAALANADDMMVYLQGGPGFGSPTPIVGLSLSSDSSWAGTALGKYYNRIVLLDQRGTGRSSPITRQSLEQKFPSLFQLDNDQDLAGKEDWKEGIKLLAVNRPDAHDAFQTALQNAANYLAQMRADNIVKDAEDIREALMIPLEPGVVRRCLLFSSVYRCTCWYCCKIKTLIPFVEFS
jgi:hypothetical protein